MKTLVAVVVAHPVVLVVVVDDAAAPLFQCLFSEHIFHYFVSSPGFLFTLQANGGNCERESFWKRV